MIAILIPWTALSIKALSFKHYTMLHVHSFTWIVLCLLHNTAGLNCFKRSAVCYVSTLDLNITANGHFISGSSVNMCTYTRTFLLDRRRLGEASPSLHVTQKLAELSLHKNHRTSRAGSRKRRKIPVLVSACNKYRLESSDRPTGANHSNLRSLSRDESVPYNHVTPIVFAVVNTRSLRNKLTSFTDFAIQRDLDICAITETWFTELDIGCVGQIEQSGYKFISIPRQTRTHGGIGLLHKPFISAKLVTSGEKDSFDYAEINIKAGGTFVSVHIIYRTPYSEEHPVPMSRFWAEFDTYLNDNLLNQNNILITGDFNIHVNKPELADTVHFQSILDRYALKQSVTCPTHIGGNTLDLIITHDNEFLVTTVPSDELYISDHSFVVCDINVPKPIVVKKKVTFRNLRRINISELQQKLYDMNSTGMCCNNLDECVSHYNDALTCMLNKLAPVVHKSVICRTKYPWFSDDLKELKRDRRKAEMHWRHSKSLADRKTFTKLRDEYTMKLNQAKDSIMCTELNKCGNDMSKMFKTVSKFLGKTSSNPIPEDDEAPDRFATFFEDKILSVRNSLEHFAKFVPAEVQCPVLASFSQVNEETVLKVVKNAKPTTCCADPFPTKLLVENFVHILPFFTKLINFSLSEARFPDTWKHAHVIPLLKKPNLDCTSLTNYRPVSNLTFASKILERVVLAQLEEHMSANDLLPIYQSAYRSCHSTETALLKLTNDLLQNMDCKLNTLSVAVDLSAAFDTVDHGILLSVASKCFGINGSVLEWISTYLQPRTFSVIVDSKSSTTRKLSYSVPQGSVLGPVLFTWYSSTILTGARINQSLMAYADDHTLYDTFKAGSAISEEQCVSCMELSLVNTMTWMSANRLKMNNAKTEAIIFRSNYYNNKLTTSSITVGDATVDLTSTMKLLGVSFDCNLTLKYHIIQKCKVASYNLSLIRKIRKYLDTDTCKLVVHALVISHIDYANSLYVGLPQCTLDYLQSIQNQAAKLILNREKYSSSTQCLHDLHWLPVHHRCDYKILCLVFKCLHDQAPQYLTEYINIRDSQYNIRSLDSATKGVKLNYSRPRTTFGARSFSVYGPTAWNELPSELKLIESFDTFRAKLKTHLFNLPNKKRKRQ